MQFFLILQNPPPPKVTKSTYQPQNCFGATKVYLHWETKIVLMGNQKWQKNLNLKNWKSQILIFGHFGGVSIFQIQFFLSFLVSHQKNIFFSEQTYFCLTKNIFGMITLIEKKISEQTHLTAPPFRPFFAKIRGRAVSPPPFFPIKKKGLLQEKIPNFF